MSDSIAACDTHLPRLLDTLVSSEEGKAVTVRTRMTRLFEPDNTYKCDCGGPAFWFIRVTTVNLGRIAELIWEATGALDKEQRLELAKRIAQEAVR